MHLRRSLVALGLFSCLGVYAQDVLRPAVRQEYWVSGAVQGRLPEFLKDPLGHSWRLIRVRGELGYRSADVFFAGKQTYLDVNVRYKISDLLSVAYEHRFATRSSADGIRHRSILQAQFTKSFDRIDADYRFIYQHSYIEWGGQREVFPQSFPDRLQHQGLEVRSAAGHGVLHLGQQQRVVPLRYTLVARHRVLAEQGAQPGPKPDPRPRTGHRLAHAPLDLVLHVLAQPARSLT